MVNFVKKLLLFLLVTALLLPAAGCGTAAPAQTEPDAPATFTPEPTATPSPSPEPTPSPSPTPEPIARELTESMEISDNYGGYLPFLTDGDLESWVTYKYGTEIYIDSEEEISALYICWFRIPLLYATVRCCGSSFPAAENGYIYEYIELPEPTNHVELAFSARSEISEIRAFGVGAPPPDVQVWEPPLEQADVLIFPTHSDDDVIFFGGLIADCVDRGLAVQLCFMVEHFDILGYPGKVRTQELLSGLWEMGIHNYPIIGPFQDHFLKSLESAREIFQEDKVIEFQVEQIRRFKPMVVVGHDRYGEYGHAAHQLNALCLEKAVPLAADPTAFPKAFSRWGAWDTPKLYLHYAPENQIVIDVETPLESFGGRTAFEVAQDAMEYHVSQLRYPHRPTLDDPKFPRYDCRKFGLVRTTVGYDTGSDIMENTGW